MHAFVLRKVLGWGSALWLFGYALGLVFYAIVPPDRIGWYVMPFGLAATIYVLLFRARPATILQSALIGAGWCLIAVVCDYVFLVRLLQPADGYYKPDVFLYYLTTLLLPFLPSAFGRR